MSEPPQVRQKSDLHFLKTNLRVLVWPKFYLWGGRPKSV